MATWRILKQGLFFQINWCTTIFHKYISKRRLTSCFLFLLVRVNTGLADTKGSYKPVFVVYVQSVNIECELVSGEVKPSNVSVDQAESDLVMTGKEMNQLYNRLFMLGVQKPSVCGVLVEGYTMKTSKIDVLAPNIYDQQYSPKQ
ncbi:hypothetical protein BDB00DRAFT_809299 [Zychaea mexicana]|uniref:uncharacterized protein n=1 Tax=Zychaea mexicana TaxID=64656 RepID=UPI0022FEE373|nr:uncharacterized protein BDB00DRAFT_809299 [Zychaea mexicana]KAI9496548.1 hypothetical protein BDB00DRAFT_809299 [Zychaea mexicana]